MLTKMIIRNFKLFANAEIELGERVVFVGPNNSGKTSALQALALWNAGIRRWSEKRGAGNVPKERAGVTINRRDLIALPVPAANLLWRDLGWQETHRNGSKKKTDRILISIDVEGIDDGKAWKAVMEFDYANEESFYCRSPVGVGGSQSEIPPSAAAVRLAYLPPMSGLASNETRLDDGAIDVRIGEGRTAEVLRNLCWNVQQNSGGQWVRIVERLKALFGVTLEEPQYIKERGEVVMSFRTISGVKLDLSASGRGQQQTLLLLAHMAANPGSVLLLDEPDAHLEVLRQGQIYQVLSETAAETGSQIIVASHSEVILNEAADRDTVVAFIGTPHRIDDRGSQLAKALKEIGFEQYIQAEETGWVLYLEGSTDLAILRAFAKTLGHRACAALDRPFVHYVANQPTQARHHFYGLREARSDLIGVALYDRLNVRLHSDPSLSENMWQRREIENYLCHKSALLAFSESEGRKQLGDLFAATWRKTMDSEIDRLATALAALGKPDPWSADLKTSDDFLDPLFQNFYQKLELPNMMRKTDYHTLAPFVTADQLGSEVREKLDTIADAADRARARGNSE
jgi:ABC-type branched-subunit amino acid transport system ATPase component